MFDPSPKQLDAIANMEAFIGVRSHRTHFVSREEFHTYWDLLAGRCERERQRRQRQAAEDPQQRQQRRSRQAAARQAHYRDADTLIAYGRRYAQRYGPSWAKLRAQLQRKCDDPTVVAAALGGLGAYNDDHARARELVLRFQDQGRNRRDMTAKLRQRLFPPAVIDAALAACSDAAGSVLDQDAVAERIGRMQRAGKSQRMIRQQIGSGGADQPVVEAAMADAFSTADDQDNLRRALRSMGSGIDRQKAIQRLLRRGFAWPDIKRVLEDEG
jgi:SOS response regulatory protein OraA/RecX